MNAYIESITAAADAERRESRRKYRRGTTTAKFIRNVHIENERPSPSSEPLSSKTEDHRDVNVTREPSKYNVNHSEIVRGKRACSPRCVLRRVLNVKRATTERRSRRCGVELTLKTEPPPPERGSEDVGETREGPMARQSCEPLGLGYLFLHRPTVLLF